MVLCLLTAFCAAIPAQANTLVVMNNNDSGAGSLRQAIADAAAGALQDLTASRAASLVAQRLGVR